MSEPAETGLRAELPSAGLEGPDTESLADSPLPFESPTRRWLRGLEVDLRSLAAFRIAVGTCLVADLLLRIPNLEVFYTDQGVEPRELLVRHLGDASVLTLHLISGQWIIQLALFLIAILFGLGFLVGYHTRLCAIVSWFFLTSLQMRNAWILHGGDVLLRVLLFWSMFAPVHGRWSLDRALNRDARPMPVTNLSPAGVALLFQICVVYWFAAADKMHPVWITERSAIYYALSLESFATPFGKWLLPHDGLIQWMSLGTVVLEFFGPIVALSPFLTGPARLLVAGSFIGFHMGLAISMRLGLFPWICASAWLAFLPGMFWDLFRRTREGEEPSPPGSWLAGLRRRPRIARALVWRKPRAPTDHLPLLAQLLIIACMALLVWGLVFPKTIVPGTKEARIRWRLASITTLGQRWTLFSPYPARDDGWFIMAGKKKDGSLVDVWDDRGPSTDAKPEDFGSHYRDVQWVKYFTFFRILADSTDRSYFGKWLCRKWNQRQDSADRISEVKVDYMLEFTPPPGKPLPSPQRLPIMTHECAETARGK